MENTATFTDLNKLHENLMANHRRRAESVNEAIRNFEISRAESQKLLDEVDEMLAENARKLESLLADLGI